MSGLRKRGKSPQITKKKSIPLLNKAGHHLKSAAPDNQKAHERKFKVALAFVTLLAFYSRFYKIATPDEVVFDEVHFGKFASYYLQRTYFFDLHPPFAKLLIALVGWLVGYDGSFKFDNIGDDYNKAGAPYIAYRSLSATLGAITVPTVFMILKESNYGIPACILASCLVLFDNAHVTETRLILLDATLILSVALSILCYVKFSKQRQLPFSKKWWTWLILTGISLSCVISTKYVGTFTFATIGVAVLVDLWNLLDIKKGISMIDITRHFIARGVSLIILPFIIYLFWFWCHFAILSKSGPGDPFMSPEFQETLGDSPLAKEAKVVNYYDIITIKHKDTGTYLHSHPDKYPLRYDDGRVSSQGQQVTGYIQPDINNHWVILPQIDFPEESKLGKPVKEGDIIRLQHYGTNTMLLTHDVASPWYPTNEEVTTVSLEDAYSTRYNDTLFELRPQQDSRKGEKVETKASLLRFVHVPTKVAIWTQNTKLLPEWGFNQQEVNGNKVIQDNSNIWTFDQIIGLNGERAIYVPKPRKSLPFLKKWWELQIQMFARNNALSSEHPYASEPASWPITLKGVSFWTKNDTRAQIYFVGNFFGWWLEVVLIAIYAGVFVAEQLTRRRAFYTLSDASRNRMYNSLGFLLVGWAAHYFPFFLMSRQKFLHHYLPAHLIAACFSGGMVEFLFTDNRGPGLLDPHDKADKIEILKQEETRLNGGVSSIPYNVFVLVLVIGTISCFVYFAPLTYGDQGLTTEQVVARQWLQVQLHFAK